MSSLTPSPAANVWVDPAGTDDDLPVPAFRQDNGSSQFVLATTGAKDAAYKNWKFDRVEYEKIDLRAPYVLIDDGAGNPTPSSSGTAIAILVEYGDDQLEVSTDLTATAAGAFYLGTNGDLIAVRFDAPEKLYLKSGTNYNAFTVG